MESPELASLEDVARYITRPVQFLMVEDDIVIRDLFILYAKRWNCVITPAGTGKEAIELASATIFDTVFLDIRLPDMDGVSVMRSLLALNPKLNIVVVSGDINRDVIDRVMDIGFAMFVQKPNGFRHEVIDKLFRTLHITELPCQILCT